MKIRIVLLFIAAVFICGKTHSAVWQSIKRSHQKVIKFSKDIRRVAVSDPDLLNADPVTNREVLVQAIKSGRTNVFIWFADGTKTEYRFTVLSSLTNAEKRIINAIQVLDNDIGKDVSIRRIIRGSSANNDEDIFILEGEVPNQVALVRVITVASRVLTGKSSQSELPFRVIADESGALLRRNAAGQNTGVPQADEPNRGGTLFLRALNNSVRQSIGRAKVLEAADGRLISFIKVRDLPSVRVTARILQLDRSKLKEIETNIAATQTRRRQTTSPLTPFGIPNNIGSLPGNSNATFTPATIPDSQNFTAILGGLLTDRFQYAGSRFVIDAALSALETKGVARIMAEPTMNVLSGESALFQVGGQVPVSVTEATNVGVFQGFEFRNFGIELAIRPLVDENENIILDVIPRINTPVVNPFSTVNTAPAFETTFLKTTTLLEDGQALLVGGLIDQTFREDKNQVPILGDIPLLGWLFRGSSKRDEDSEVVIVVTPTLIRKPIKDLALWQYPDFETN